jgi:hypothetical protein
MIVGDSMETAEQTCHLVGSCQNISIRDEDDDDDGDAHGHGHGHRRVHGRGQQMIGMLTKIIWMRMQMTRMCLAMVKMRRRIRAVL